MNGGTAQEADRAPGDPNQQVAAWKTKGFPVTAPCRVACVNRQALRLAGTDSFSKRSQKAIPRGLSEDISYPGIRTCYRPH